MRIVDFVKPELVIAELGAKTKPEVIAELARHMAAQIPGVERDKVERVLNEREKLASTAIGEGVAIPHGKLAAVSQLWGCVARSKSGVDFDSMDGKATHLFFVLIAPENSTGVHLKALARISRLFKDPGFRTRLMTPPDGQSVYQVIADEDAKY